MAFLGQLCFLQRLVSAGEISARILPVAIEEQTVKASVEVVVMGGVFLRAHGRVVLIDPSLQLTQERSKPKDWVAFKVASQIRANDAQHIEDAKTVRGNGAIHIGFTQGKTGVQR